MMIGNRRDPIDIATGTRLRLQRKAAGLSQADLAAALGVSYQQLQKYERGENRVSASKLVKAAERLGVSLSALLGENGSLSISKPDPLLTRFSTPGVPELVEAFLAIKKPAHRRAVIDLARALG